MRFLMTLSALLMFVISAPAMAKTYSFNPKATKISWTAYKFTRKAPVNGFFAKFSAKGKTSGKSAAAVVKGIHLTVDTASVKTGNPARDVNIAMNFFKKFTGGPKVHIKVLKFDGKPEGTLVAQIKVHKLVRKVKFKYSLSKAGAFEAHATIDMLKFGLNAPYKSIHTACEGLHKGKDGKSVTWTDVQLHVSTKLTVK